MPVAGNLSRHVASLTHAGVLLFGRHAARAWRPGPHALTPRAGDAGDVGSWGEALGIASLFVEGSFLMLTVGVLAANVVRGEVLHRPRPNLRSR